MRPTAPAVSAPRSGASAPRIRRSGRCGAGRADRDATLRALQNVPPAEIPRSSATATSGRSPAPRRPDGATSAAIRRHGHDRRGELLELPPSLPRSSSREAHPARSRSPSTTVRTRASRRRSSTSSRRARRGHVLRHRHRRLPISRLVAARLRRGSRDRQPHLHAHRPRADVAVAARLELMLTQRLIQSRLGVSTLLFRPPYGVDDQRSPPPASSGCERSSSSAIASSARRSTPTTGDTSRTTARPAPTRSSRRVLEQARAGDGHVVLLHDGGGDRQNTVAALPRHHRRAARRGLRARARLDAARRDASRRRCLRSASAAAGWRAPTRVVFDAFRSARLGIAAVCFTAIVLIATRSLAVIGLAVVHKRRRKPAAAGGLRPLVSVLVPAYDEEKVDRCHARFGARSRTTRSSRSSSSTMARATPRARSSRLASRGDDRGATASAAEPRKSAALNRGVGEAQRRDPGHDRRRHRVEAGTIASSCGTSWMTAWQR